MRYAFPPLPSQMWPPVPCAVSIRAKWLACVILTRMTAHCRRRKIRCLLAEGDSQERCQNCVRLKKECVFYPVDQQQVLDNRSQSGTKSGAGSVPSSAVSPSPPELASGRPFERSRQYGSFASLPSLPSNAPSGYGAPLPPGATLQGQGDFIPPFTAHGLPNHDSVGPSPTEYSFQQPPTENQRHWEQVNNLNSPSASMNRARDSMQSQYWRSSPTGPSADFAPFPNGGSSTSQMPPPDGSFSYPAPNSQAWHPSQSGRSMSYGHMQDMTPTGYIPSAAGYAPQPAHEGPPTGAATYSSSGATHAPVMASAPGQSSHMGAPMMPFGQQQSPFMFQSQGAVSASPIPTQHPFTNQWYGESSQYGGSDQDLRSPADNRSFTNNPGQ